MDTFTEQLVIERKPARYAAVVALLTLAAIAVLTGVLMIYVGLLPIALVGVGYGWWWAVRMQVTEYEYCVTNGDIDVDQIRGRSKRKRIVSVRGEKIESLAPCAATDDFSRFDRVVRCNSCRKDATLWCFTYHHKRNGHTAVIFEPNAKVLNALIDGLPALLRREVTAKYTVPQPEVEV